MKNKLAAACLQPAARFQPELLENAKKILQEATGKSPQLADKNVCPTVTGAWRWLGAESPEWNFEAWRYVLVARHMLLLLTGVNARRVVSTYQKRKRHGDRH